MLAADKSRRQNMSGGATRRDFLAQLGVTAAATFGASAAGISVAGIAQAQDKPKGTIPDKPYRIGHMTFFTGAPAVLGEPMYKGNLLAADEINAHGGLLGKRKIEILKADEAAGTDANVKEMRRLRLSEKIDLFMGITSSGNTPALGPVAEELKLLTMFVDGSTDFTPHITKAMAAKPDLLVTSIWGGDYVALYKQALQYGLFSKMKVATTLGLGTAPQAIGKDHPEGVLGGVHSNYHFTYPPANRWPLNKTFVENYHAKFNEYPNFQAEGAYTGMYMIKTAIEKANKLAGGWPDDEMIISQLEGMMFP